MELTEGVQTVRHWIQSCSTIEQVDLLPTYISDYFLPLFERDGAKYADLTQAGIDLMNALTDRRKVLAEIMKPYSATDI